MQARDVMTSEVKVVNPETTIREAARMMRELDTGILPVCDGFELVGVITDRDIVLRSTADGKDPGNTDVKEAMTPEAAFCLEDEYIDRIIHRMEENGIRRMPVISHGKKLTGMISLADLVRHGESKAACEVLEKVSKPGPGEKES